MKTIETIQKGIAHRPFNKNSEQHEQFLKDLELKKSTIQNQFPTQPLLTNFFEFKIFQELQVFPDSSIEHY